MFQPYLFKEENNYLIIYCITFSSWK